MDAPDIPQPPITPDFIDVFKRSQIGYKRFLNKAVDEKISPHDVDAMLLGAPVSRADAEKVLSVLSQLTGETLTLENTVVSLLAPGKEEGDAHVR